MPIKHAAEKALRKAKKAKVLNRSVKDEIKNLIKTGRKALIAGKTDEVKGLMSQLAKKVDKAAQRDIIKKNTAARIKSRFAKALKKTVTK